MPTIKILIADDQQLVREALGTLLSLQPDIELVGICGRGDEVLPLVQETKADVVLLDINLCKSILNITLGELKSLMR